MVPAVPQEAGVVGIDVSPVTEWITDTVPGTAPPLTFELIAGGRSNLTYRVTDAAGRRLALRRPPVSHVLPTAHDMGREHRLISALFPTDVPVPRPFGLCADEKVNGAPFYVMEFVDGHIVRDAAQAAEAFDVATRAAVGPNMADTLATLHAVDVDAVGLGDLARHEGYIERQLRRWREQYRQMIVPGAAEDATVEEVGAALAATVPDQQAVAVVHGDYRLDNVVLDDAGRVRAILDWEICTLGDPLADIGLLLVYWAEAGDDQSAILGVAPTSTPGFSSRQTVLDRYRARSGLDVRAIGFYMAFGYWKLACILQGVYARHVAGAGGGDRSSVVEFPAHIHRLAVAAGERLSAG